MYNLSLKSFEKGHWGYHKKMMEKKRDMKKREKKEIAHVLTKGFFKVSIKREMCFKEHNKIRIATLYPHTCTSWFDCMIFFSMDPLFDIEKYAMQECLQSSPT